MNTSSITLIVNAFLNSPQTNETYKWIMDSGKRHGIHMTMRTNADYCARLDTNTVDSIEPDTNDCIIFWNKDTCLGRALEHQGKRLFNSSQAIANCDNKALTTEAIVASPFADKIKMPTTIKIPMTFAGVGYNKFDFIDKLEAILGFPFVIKECLGSYGGQVYLANNKQDAINILSRIDGNECIAQEYIKKSRGRDLRVYVVGDRVVAAMERRNDNDFRANITNGGSSLPYSITREQEEMAIAAAQSLGLDFAGVDLMFLDNDAPILCEVNSNAQFLGLYEATKINIPDEIFDYILSINL